MYAQRKWLVWTIIVLLPSLALEVIDRRASGERSQAAGIVFAIGHPVADAGDDQSAGPIMRLVVSYQPGNYMAFSEPWNKGWYET